MRMPSPSAWGGEASGEKLLLLSGQHGLVGAQGSADAIWDEAGQREVRRGRRAMRRGTHAAPARWLEGSGV